MEFFLGTNEQMIRLMTFNFPTCCQPFLLVINQKEKKGGEKEKLSLYHIIEQNTVEKHFNFTALLNTIKQLHRENHKIYASSTGFWGDHFLYIRVY